MNKPLIALVGAGGKMGRRISPNLEKFGHNFICCEKDEHGLEALTARGLRAMPTPDAMKIADIVVFAVPDAAIPALSKTLVPLLKPGATVITLDPAAAHAGQLTTREDCTFVVTHPCHPPLFASRDTPEEKADLFGGSAAQQDIVIALMQGEEAKFDVAEKLCRDMFAPVGTAHRITVEQIADGLFSHVQEQSLPDLEVYRAYSASQALSLLRMWRMDVVISDIQMPGMNGLELAEYILRAWPRCQIIFLTGYDNFDYLYRAQKLGTIQYILKNEGYLKRCRNYLSRSATSVTTHPLYPKQAPQA